MIPLPLVEISLLMILTKSESVTTIPFPLLWTLNHLIIVFIRGKNYKNRSKIIFEEKINLGKYIEPDNNTPKNFTLVGSVNRKIENDLEEYVPYSQGFNDIQKFNNEQIIMLFYNSKDYNESENN